MHIGVVGLGPMGSALARLLIKSGHDVSVFNRTRARAQAIEGARIADTPADAARGDAVLSMLADDGAVESLVFGPHGIAEGLKRDALHISSSTISTALADRLDDAHRERGQFFVAAPVLGRPPAAEAGKLFVMAAGEAAALALARPVLDAIGQRLFILGDRPSQASLVKLCANFLIFSTIEQFAEVFAIAEKGGVDRGAVFELLTESFFGAPVHRNYGKLILDRAYDPPGAKMTLGAKDTRLFLAAGERLDVPLPYASILRDRFLASIARGEADLDFTAIAKRAAEDAGL